MFAQGQSPGPLYPPQVQLKLSVYVYTTDYLARFEQPAEDVVELAKRAHDWIIEQNAEVSEITGGQYI
jgi:hypothetical protein